MVAGILLTGGQSRRLGVDKARVELDGEALAERTARALSAECDPCIEVGSGASSLRSIRESPPGDGPLAAFVAGVRALELDAVTSVMLLACDMPLVSVELLRAIIDCERATVVPVVDGRAQFTCAKYGGEVLEAMLRAFDRGERSFRWLRDDECSTAIEWFDGRPWSGAFRDVDTREDARMLGITIP